MKKTPFLHMDYDQLDVVITAIMLIYGLFQVRKIWKQKETG